ncbi:MAG TPA: DUF6789 family protein [Pseudomonadales bacterium]
MDRGLIGAFAGMAATAAMTIAVDAMFSRLPREQRYPLPPREITTKVAAESGLARHLSESRRVSATLISHFGFGAAVGALYPLVARLMPGPPMLNGIAYGIAVWAGSYFGWIPAFGILRPATTHPTERSVVMILGHVVWGAVTGVVADRLERAGASSLAGGEMRDWG